MERYAYFTFFIIAVTCGFSFLGFRDRGLQAEYIFWPEAILGERQYYRLITSGFLHLDTWHLVMNMVSLYFFGPLMERICGPTQFLIIYLAAIVGGNLLALYVHRHHDYRALGASGGVCGIIFAYVFYFPSGGINPFYFLPINIPAPLYAIGFLLLSFYGMQRRLDNVGHDAHLGGALVGLFTAAAFNPSIIRRSPGLFATISVATALLFFYLARNPTLAPLRGFDFTRKRRPRSDLQETPRRADNEVDAILQKISEQGLHSLTEEEREKMDETSAKYRRRAVREKRKSDFPF